MDTLLTIFLGAFHVSWTSADFLRWKPCREFPVASWTRRARVRMVGDVGGTWMSQAKVLRHRGVALLGVNLGFPWIQGSLNATDFGSLKHTYRGCLSNTSWGRCFFWGPNIYLFSPGDWSLGFFFGKKTRYGYVWWIWISLNKFPQ